MNRRRFLVACAALLAIAGTVAFPSAGRADARSDAAAKFIQDLGARAIDVLVKPQLARDESMRRFRVLLNEGFDVPYISRFVLGQNWRTATPQQQQEYGALFERLIVQVYADRFAQYSGKNLDVNETLKITGSRPEGDTDSIVSSQIIRPDAPPVAVDWRVRPRGDALKVIDVAVEGRQHERHPAVGVLVRHPARRRADREPAPDLAPAGRSGELSRFSSSSNLRLAGMEKAARKSGFFAAPFAHDALSRNLPPASRRWKTRYRAGGNNGTYRISAASRGRSDADLAEGGDRGTGIDRRRRRAAEAQSRIGRPVIRRCRIRNSRHISPARETVFSRRSC